MQGSLDISLDDLIRNGNKPGPHKLRARAPLSAYGPHRRFPTRGPALRPTPYSAPPPPPSVTQSVEAMVLSGGSQAEVGTKLYLSNLDYGVSNEDIKILFSEVGELKQHSIHYDRSGRSKGTAEVVFLHYSDAIAAIKRYNNVQLDGKPLKIELVGLNLVTPPAVLPTGESILGKPNGAFRSGHGHGKADFRGSIRGHGGGGYQNGRARGPELGRSRDEKKLTAEDLDADLEKYRLEAMQIN